MWSDIMHKIKCRYSGQPAPVIILFICSRHYWVCIMVGPCKRPHVDCPGNPRHSVLLEQLWSVCMQLRPAQVGQHLCWSSVGRTAALHREAQACSPAGVPAIRASCRWVWRLQPLWYCSEVLCDSVLGLGTVWNGGGMLLSCWTTWGLEVCSGSLRGLFMGWTELALKDSVDSVRMLLALIHVWKMRVRLDSWGGVFRPLQYLKITSYILSTLNKTWCYCIRGKGLQ